MPLIIRRVRLILALLLSLTAARIVVAAPPSPEPPRDPHERLIHLPGIAGAQDLDRRFLRGIRAGGYAGEIEIFDWPGDDPGIRALVSRTRNDRQATRFAERIQELLRDDPKLKLRLVAHSGGAGILAWALERLPDDVRVEMVVFVAPALSPEYDLSKALRHVRGRAYAFTSENDVIVLGAGTKVFGTIDGVKTEAAGLRGFVRPSGADEAAYAKLVPMPYDESWMAYDNIGDHIGAMGRAFAQQVISPIVQDKPIPATRPSTRPTTTTAREKP